MLFNGLLNDLGFINDCVFCFPKMIQFRIGGFGGFSFLEDRIGIRLQGPKPSLRQISFFKLNQITTGSCPFVSLLLGPPWTCIP